MSDDMILPQNELFSKLEDSKEIIIDSDGKTIWFSQSALASVSGTTRQDIAQKMALIRKERGEDYYATRTCIIKNDKQGRNPTYYHYNLARIAIFKSGTPEAHTYQDYINGVMDKYEFEGVAVNPKLAEQNPELVQDNFDLQFRPSMKKHLNNHAHTEAYQTERLENIQQRKRLNGQLARTTEGTPNYGQINAMFHISLTGKTKRQILAGYEHATKNTSAIDALGSIVVKQMNTLIESVRMVLEDVDSDSIPTEVQTRQVERLVKRYAEPLKQHLELLSQDLGQPIDKLGENSHKQRLL